MTGKAYIVITNYTGGWQDTIECLDSICRLDFSDYQVIVVDDGSRDDSLKFILEWSRGKHSHALPIQNPCFDLPLPPEARIKRTAVYHDNSFLEAEKKDPDALIVIRSSINRGFAGACNLGLQYALEMDDFEYVWLLNNDTVVDPKSLSHLVSRMKAKPAAGLCGSTLLFYDFPDKVQTLGGVRFCQCLAIGKTIGSDTPFRPDQPAEEIERQMDYVYGSSMLVSKNFLRDVGLLNEEYFIYFEEIDWSMRARGRYTLAFAPQSLVYHKAGATVGGGYLKGKKNSLFSDHYYFKNMIRFTRNYFVWALPVVYLRMLWMFLQKIAGRQWASALLVIKSLLRIPVDTEKLWDRKQGLEK